jgi:SAM-dependent methyltransferase
MHDDDLPAGSRDRTVGVGAFHAGGLSVASYELFVGTELSPLRGDVEFYLSCPGRYGGPVLELGVGTGRVAWLLAAAGHEVVALDWSAAMLAIAHGKAAAHPARVRDRVMLRQVDMADFDPARRFRLALIPARAFHLLTPEAQRTALSCIRRHWSRAATW